MDIFEQVARKRVAIEQGVKANIMKSMQYDEVAKAEQAEDIQKAEENEFNEVFKAEDDAELQKAHDELFGGSDDIEKAKHQVGEVHPNGKWIWTEYAPGKFDWKSKNGKHHKAKTTNNVTTNPGEFSVSDFGWYGNSLVKLYSKRKDTVSLSDIEEDLGDYLRDQGNGNVSSDKYAKAAKEIYSKITDAWRTTPKKTEPVRVDFSGGKVLPESDPYIKQVKSGDEKALSFAVGIIKVNIKDLTEKLDGVGKTTKKYAKIQSDIQRQKDMLATTENELEERKKKSTTYNGEMTWNKSEDFNKKGSDEQKLLQSWSKYLKLSNPSDMSDFANTLSGKFKGITFSTTTPNTGQSVVKAKDKNGKEIASINLSKSIDIPTLQTFMDICHKHLLGEKKKDEKSVSVEDAMNKELDSLGYFAHTTKNGSIEIYKKGAHKALKNLIASVQSEDYIDWGSNSDLKSKLEPAIKNAFKGKKTVNKAEEDLFEKAYSELFGEEYDIEKAKHQVGEVHPNGKWIWTEWTPGKFDWKSKNGKHHKGKAVSSNQEQSSSTDNKSVDEPAKKTAVKKTVEPAKPAYTKEESIKLSEELAKVKQELKKVDAKWWDERAAAEKSVVAKYGAYTQEYTQKMDETEKELDKKYKDDAYEKNSKRMDEIVKQMQDSLTDKEKKKIGRKGGYHMNLVKVFLDKYYRK